MGKRDTGIRQAEQGFGDPRGAGTVEVVQEEGGLQGSEKRVLEGLEIHSRLLHPATEKPTQARTREEALRRKGLLPSPVYALRFPRFTSASAMAEVAARWRQSAASPAAGRRRLH